MEHVRLMTACQTCQTAAHLPAFAAAEAGLFADQGIEVEFVPMALAPDYTLNGFAARPRAVADGYADFALSGVPYLLAALAEVDGRLPVRFVAVSHQRNPITAVIRRDSDLCEPGDLAGRRAARWCMPWFTDEYAGALARMGIGAPEVVDVSGDMNAALSCGEIDVIPTWMEMVFHHLVPELAVRTIALDVAVYSVGLLAADRLSLELVTRVRDAFMAGFELQRDNPEFGIAGFVRQFPQVSLEHVRVQWDLFEPYGFDRAPAGSMDAARWQDTIEYAAATHGLPVIPGERFYRSELLASPLAAATA